MAEKFLFYDIESARNVDGESYICSFGYVLCDGNFNEIEGRDIVMNPRTKFNPFMFKEDSPCRLSYPEEYFLQQPDFLEYYDEIKSLLTDGETCSIGFDVGADVGFIVDACNHFECSQFDFVSYDIQPLCDEFFGSHNRLSLWMDFLNIDCSRLEAHNSHDDALMTMYLAREVCRRKKCSLKELADGFDARLERSSAAKIQGMRIKRYLRYMKSQISLLFDRKNDSPKSRVLKGQWFVNIDNKRDIDQRYEIYRLIYDNGGTLAGKICAGCSCLIENEAAGSEWLSLPKYRNVNIVTVGELCSRLGVEDIPFKAQRADVPDVEDEFKAYMV